MTASLLKVSHLCVSFAVGRGVRHIPTRPMSTTFHHLQVTNAYRQSNRRSHVYRETLQINRLFSSGTPEITEPEPFTWPQLVQYFRHRNKNNHFVPSNHPKLELFRRSSTVQATYLKHQRNLNLHWKSAYDYLCVNKFGKPFGFKCTKYISDQMDCDDSFAKENVALYKSDPSLKEASDHAINKKMKYLSLVPNDFPYDVNVDINHYCLWKIGGAAIGEGILEDEMRWAIKELTMCSENDFAGSNLIVKNGSVEHYATKQDCLTNDEHGIVDYLYWVNPPHLQSMPEIQHAHILVLRGEHGDQINLGNLDNPLSFRSKL